MPNETPSQLALMKSLTHPLNICRQSCSWSCTCCHSTGTGSGRLRQVAPTADSTEPHTFRRRMTARPSASSFGKKKEKKEQGSDLYRDSGELDEQPSNRWQQPVLSLAPVQPVVLGGAYWAGASRVVVWAAPQADPEVSICSLELMDEPLYQPLLAFRFDAEQLASFHSAGSTGILEGQPASAVMDVGHLVTRMLCPTPADLLTCRQESASGKPKKITAHLTKVPDGLGSNTTTSASPKSSLYHLSYSHLSKLKGSRLGPSSVSLPFDLMMVFPTITSITGQIGGPWSTITIELPVI